MKCPHCGVSKLVHDTRDMPYTYKGESTIIPAVSGYFCLVCGEAVLGAFEAARLSATMLALNNHINAPNADAHKQGMPSTPQ